MTAKTKAAPEPPRAQDLTRAEKLAILRSVPCDHCGAPAGHGCGGNVPHQARYEAVGKYGKDLIRW